MRSRESKQTAESAAQFGLQAEIRLHEAGIASNRGSACHGECVPEPLHTARQATKVGGARSRDANRKEASAEGQLDDWD